MRKPKIWIVVADGQRARIFTYNGRGKELTAALDHEFIGNALPSRDINADRPGRSHDRMGPGRHAMEPPTDPHRLEKRRFARSIVDELEKHRRDSAFEQLILVAPPQTLGDFRAEMGDALKQTLKAEVGKDLTRHAVHELPALLEGTI